MSGHYTDSDEEDFHSRGMNERAWAGLEGYLVAGPSNIADEIIALLRSDHEISRKVRDILASALERGRGGYRPDPDDPDEARRPRLVIEGTGERGRLSKAVLVRRKWIKAAEQLETERNAGRNGVALALEIANKHGIDYEMMKKANKFYSTFIKEYSDTDSELNRSVGAFGYDDRSHEDHYYIARSTYIEREAAKVVGVSFEDLGD